MAKRLRIEAEIALPADPFEEADAVSKMRDPIAALKQVVEAAGGKVTHSVVAERAPKKTGEKASQANAATTMGALWEERAATRG